MGKFLLTISNKNCSYKILHGITQNKEMKNMIKKFGLKDLIAANFIRSKTLIEMISMYPTNGVGFHVRKQDWPANKYFVLTDVELNGNRNGTAYGILYENNQRKMEDS